MVTITQTRTTQPPPSQYNPPPPPSGLLSPDAFNRPRTPTDRGDPDDDDDPNGPPGGAPGGPPGGPPGGGAGNAAAAGWAPNLISRPMGQLPAVFDGDRSKAESFVDQLNTYFQLNHQVESYQSFLTRIALALTLVQGPLVQEWGRHMGEWLDNRLAFEDNRDT
jgi:hypothetical protein